MNFYSINKVTMLCPICNTEIKFEVPPEYDAEEMRNLLSASENFMCPICQEKFGGAHELLQKVDVYNKFIAEFKQYSGIFKVKFE